MNPSCLTQASTEGRTLYGEKEKKNLNIERKYNLLNMVETDKANHNPPSIGIPLTRSVLGSLKNGSEVLG